MKIKLEDIYVSARFVTSKIEYLDNPEKWENDAHRYLVQQIAEIIVRDRSETINNDIEYFVERKLDLYVAKPDVFWEIVTREAERIAGRFLYKNYDFIRREL